MSAKKTETKVDRRGFLKGIGTGAAGAATIAAGTAAPAIAAESNADKKKARYKESEHIKKFYATNRY